MMRITLPSSISSPTRAVVLGPLQPLIQGTSFVSSVMVRFSSSGRASRQSRMAARAFFASSVSAAAVRLSDFLDRLAARALRRSSTSTGASGRLSMAKFTAARQVVLGVLVSLVMVSIPFWFFGLSLTFCDYSIADFRKNARRNFQQKSPGFLCNVPNNLKLWPSTSALGQSNRREKGKPFSFAVFTFGSHALLPEGQRPQKG